jgi:NAD(P)-dependent dehydrogenase (short-subunit alcohol dehydrogenase family)
MTDGMTDGPVWFVTGCTTGFGRELAEQVLAKGWRAAITGRGKDRMADLAEGHGDRALLLELDVTEPDQVQAAVKAALDRFGRIDVLVNNAGYGYQTTIEESDDQAIRDQFETNVFGLFAVTKAVLPAMRAQRGGHVINISSVAGFIGYPGSAFYAASKHAVEGFTDSLRAEGEALGIKATAIEPGPFRTDWAGRSLKQDRSRIGDYAETVASRMSQVSGYSGKQPGDPARAAAAIIAVAGMPDPPRHLVLGRVGFEAVTRHLRAQLEEIEGRKDEALAADFPEGWAA